MVLATPEAFADLLGTPGIPLTNVQQSALDAAIGMVKNYTNQTLDLVTDDEVLLDGTGAISLLLPQIPVVAVSTVSLTDPVTVETEIVDYVVGNAGILYRSPGWYSTWPAGHVNVFVKYTHGYAVIPDEISFVVLELANRIVTGGGSSSSTITSESIGTYSVTYGTTLTRDGLLDVERLVLDKYRQTRFA